ncbi:MAG: aminodeoxychorismate/anthranilate synthase component II [Bacteroidia bacterium]
MKLLLLDNYDSFTFNLLHYVEQVNDVDVKVFRNDEISIEAVDEYDSIILSPGPGLPKDAGILLEVIKQYASTKKILGVCLGMQAIGEAYGGTLKNLNKVQHGISRPTFIADKDELLYKNLPSEINCGRYHSWVVDEKTFPDCLKITAVDKEKNIMSLRHTIYNVCGVQFHPESILTEHGLKMIENWMMNDD